MPVPLVSHAEALRLTSEYAGREIVTTDEILSEFLTFFCEAPEQLRREVGETVVTISRPAYSGVTPS